DDEDEDEDEDDDDEDDDEDEDEDEDEEEEDDDEDENDNEGMKDISLRTDKNKAKPLSDNSKYYKAPTNEEIQQLRETTELFNTNLFRLQIEELLSEVRINSKKTVVLEKALHKLKSILDNMKPVPEKSLSEITKLMKKKNIKIPFPNTPPKDIQYKFAFKAPNSVNLVGSYLLQSACKTPIINNIDLAVEMPKEIFQEKDHMNYRYFYKRAYYLANIAANIQDHKKDFKVKMEFDLFQDDQRQPILVLYGSGDNSEFDFSKSSFCIRILPSISPSVFPIQRLAPTRNNVRPTVEMSTLPPTPLYNNIILTETAYVSHLNILHRYTKSCAAFKDACILAKVWLNQRDFNGRNGRLSGFIFAMIMAWLIKCGGPDGSKKLGLSYSSFQLFKITIEFIATHDFVNKPIIMTDNQEPISSEFSVDSFSSTNEIVMIDMTGRVNLAANITKYAMLEIQNEAKLAIQNLTGEDSADKFDTLFLQKINPCLKYDNILRIPPLSVPAPLYTVSAALDNPSACLHLKRKLPNLLAKALTDRITHICSFNPLLPKGETSVSHWKINEKMPESNQTIMIGINLDGNQSTRLVDYGPTAEDEVASKAFRELWGEKSELRRFKDGSILESVVWELNPNNNSNVERSLIISRMVSFILERHIGIKMISSIQSYARLFSTQLNSFLIPFDSESTHTFKDAIAAFQDFSRELQNLDGLPLAIVSVQPCSPGLRYTSVFEPQPIKNSPALDVVITFEQTTRWPDDLKAIQIMKSALLLELSKELLKKEIIKDAIINVGNSQRKIEAVGYVDFVLESGYTFRCRIHQEREEVLLRRITDSKAPQAIAKSNEYQECVRALSIIDNHFNHGPILSVKIQNLCLKFPSLSYTIRLVKRWLSAHLFSKYHISDSIVELICAKVYTNPSPWDTPNSGWAGFIHVLYLFAHYNFTEEPLIIPIELESLEPGAEAKQTQNELLYDKKMISTTSPSIPMVIATELDPEGRYWTGKAQDRPTKMIMKRLKYLSQAALIEIENIILKGHDSDLKKLFVTPKQDFDVIIKLDDSKIINYKENLYYDVHQSNKNSKKIKYKNLEIDQEENYEFDQFNPINYYLYNLKKSFGNIAYFFYDQYGGDCIYVLWNKKAFGEIPQNWKINIKYSTMPDSENVKPNVTAIMGEMQRLGQGFVKGFVINKTI
ncbi:Nrap protein, partial [Anaeromyces robustus]